MNANMIKILVLVSSIAILFTSGYTFGYFSSKRHAIKAYRHAQYTCPQAMYKMGHGMACKKHGSMHSRPYHDRHHAYSSGEGKKRHHRMCRHSGSRQCEHGMRDTDHRMMGHREMGRRMMRHREMGRRMMRHRGMGWDLNRDGQVTAPENMNFARRNFYARDMDSDGQLQRDEFLGSRGKGMGALFDRLDMNGDGVLLRSEMEEAAQQRFEQADQDDDGVLNLQERRNAMRDLVGVDADDAMRE